MSGPKRKTCQVGTQKCVKTWEVWALALLLAACGPQPTAALTPGAPPTASAPAPTAPATLAPSLTPPSVPPTPTAPPAPTTLTLCLGAEPASLYRYARPEPGRDHLFAALYDGPIDAYGYGFAPVLITALPTTANSGVQTRTVSASPGELVVDALGRVLPLEAGLTLLLADGTPLAYAGDGPVDLPQTVVTFHLRPGLRWSDGAPLTAADSVYAYALGRSPDAADPMQAVAARTASYTAPDPATLVWTGLPGDVDPLAHTHLWPPLPQHLWTGLTPVEIADSPAANRSPLGWGPYVLAEWAAGDHLLLERNPHYWRAAEGLPRLDRVRVRFLPEPEALAAALLDGECHLAPSGPTLDAAAPALAGVTAVRLAHVPGPILEHLDFGLLPAEGTSVLADGRVRQGLAHCLDRPALAPYPAGTPPDSYLPASHPLHVPAAAYAFDPARGRALLAEAGWADADGDGALDVPLTLAGGPEGSPPREALLAALQAQLRDHCGVAVALRPLTGGELAADWPLGVLFGRRFHLAVFGWRVGALPPCALYTSLQIASDANPAGANAAGYAQPAYDAACYRALAAGDPAAAAAAHAEAQRLLLADLPMLPLFFHPRHGASAPSVAGYALDGSSKSELWNIEIIEIK